MTFTITKAKRTKGKLRIGLFGGAGFGKTMSALRLAYGIVGNWDEIGYIDTEHGSAALYANSKTKDGFEIGEFLHGNLEPPYHPERYIAAIRAMEETGAKLIIVDSITHEWIGQGGLLDLVDMIAQTKYKGNGQAAWKDATPLHTKFIDAMLMSKAHIIACARSKMEYAMSDGDGKKRGQKIGMAPQTRDGFEYEMTVGLDLYQNHYAESSKDRTGIFDTRTQPYILTENDGKALLDWYNAGADDSELETVASYAPKPLEQAPAPQQVQTPQPPPQQATDHQPTQQEPPKMPASIAKLPKEEQEFAMAFTNACQQQGTTVKQVLKYFGLKKLGDIPKERRPEYIAALYTLDVDPETGDVIPDDLSSGQVG